jgi:hypothetical protein
MAWGNWTNERLEQKSEKERRAKKKKLRKKLRFVFLAQVFGIEG